MRPGACGAPACQGCGGKIVENPPPGPWPLGWPGSLFHTTSVCRVLLVPPQPMTKGLDAGRSTLAGVSPPSPELLSPEAANTTIPADVAAFAALLSCVTKSVPICWP